MTRSQPVLCFLRSRPLQGYARNANEVSRPKTIQGAPESARICYGSSISKRFIHQSTSSNADVSSSRNLMDNALTSSPPANETTPHILPAASASASITSSSSSIATNLPTQPSSSSQPLIFKVAINPSTTPASLERPVDLSFLHQFLTPTILLPPSSSSSTSASSSSLPISTTSTSQSPLSAPVQNSTQIPTAVPDIKTYPYKYHVARTASAQLPIYQTRKRGGNLLLTLIRKITGDLDAFRDELVRELNLLGEREDVFTAKSAEEKDRRNDKGANRKGTVAAAAAAAGAKRKKPKSAKQAKYAKPVKVDDVCWIKRECGHIVVKGHYAPDIIQFLKAKGL